MSCWMSCVEIETSLFGWYRWNWFTSVPLQRILTTPAYRTIWRSGWSEKNHSMSFHIQWKKCVVMPIITKRKTFSDYNVLIENHVTRPPTSSGKNWRYLHRSTDDSSTDDWSTDDWLNFKNRRLIDRRLIDQRLIDQWIDRPPINRHPRLIDLFMGRILAIFSRQLLPGPDLLQAYFWG
jgi:hypothetical protein